MSRIQFDYAWHNEAKTVMRYSARDNWTWKDYHAVVHVSQFAFMNMDGPVHVLIDFSTGQRDRFPGGIAAHAQTFGKRHSPALSGKAVVIGVPADALSKLGVSESRKLVTADGEVRFVATSDDAADIFAEWA